MIVSISKKLYNKQNNVSPKKRHIILLKKRTGCWETKQQSNERRTKKDDKNPIEIGKGI